MMVLAWVKNEYERGESLTLNNVVISKVIPLGFKIVNTAGLCISYYDNIDEAKKAIEKQFSEMLGEAKC